MSNMFVAGVSRDPVYADVVAKAFLDVLAARGDITVTREAHAVAFLSDMISFEISKAKNALSVGDFNGE